MNKLSRSVTLTVLFLCCICNIALGKCEKDHQCFPEARKCCDGICSKRRFCDGSCRDYNGDCDLSKSEKCFRKRCTAEDWTQAPGYCEDRYDCGRGEMCQSGRCFSVGDDEDNSSETEGNTNAIVVIVVVVALVVGILLAVGVYMCCSYRKERRARCRRSERRRRRRSSRGGSSNSRRSHSSFGAQGMAPETNISRTPIAPPAYDEIACNQGGIPEVPPPSYDEATGDRSV